MDIALFSGKHLPGIDSIRFFRVPFGQDSSIMYVKCSVVRTSNVVIMKGDLSLWWASN